MLDSLYGIQAFNSATGIVESELRLNLLDSLYGIQALNSATSHNSE